MHTEHIRKDLPSPIFGERAGVRGSKKKGPGLGALKGTEKKGRKSKVQSPK
jgi:hypothetical protein